MGFYPDDWDGDYPSRDAARSHEAVDERWCNCGSKTPQAAGHKLTCPASEPNRPKPNYLRSTMDSLAIELDRLLGEKDHPEGCHCSACFALRSYNAEKMFGKGAMPSDGTTKVVCQGTPFNPGQGDMFEERKQFKSSDPIDDGEHHQ